MTEIRDLRYKECGYIWQKIKTISTAAAAVGAMNGLPRVDATDSSVRVWAVEENSLLWTRLFLVTPTLSILNHFVKNKEKPCVHSSRRKPDHYQTFPQRFER